MTEIIELPPAETALKVYSTPCGLDPWLDKIRTEVTGLDADLSTKKGREAVASRAFKVRKIKTALDALGKEQVDRLKDIPKKIDAERKRMRDTLDALADEVRKPLTDWEQAEEDRLARHRWNIDWFGGQVEYAKDGDADKIKGVLTAINERIVDETWEEFEAEAHRAKARAVDVLSTALASREKYDAEQAELAELRRKQAEQERKDREADIARRAAEQARADEEAKARADRDASAKREAEAKAAAEKAERDRLDAIDRQKQAEARAEAERLAAEQRAKDAAEAARKAEIRRQADEAARIAEETRQREANKVHRGKINRAALEAFISGGMTQACAKQAVTLIAMGKIPAVKINY